MPPNMGTRIDVNDPRFRTGAYIANHRDLYQVIGPKTEPSEQPGLSFVTLECENCRTCRIVGLSVTRVRDEFKLVLEAPVTPDRIAA